MKLSIKLYWAMEFLTNSSGRRPGWHLDLRTIRRRRFEALQAPLDNDSRPEFWDSYHAMRSEGKARVVKLRVARMPL